MNRSFKSRWLLAPLAAASKGIVKRLDDGADGVTLPQILTVRGDVRISDPDRMVIRMTDETVLKGVTSIPLFAGFLGLGRNGARGVQHIGFV